MIASSLSNLLYSRLRITGSEDYSQCWGSLCALYSWAWLNLLLNIEASPGGHWQQSAAANNPTRRSESEQLFRVWSATDERTHTASAPLLWISDTFNSMNTNDAKEYLSKRQIPHLFEVSLTALRKAYCLLISTKRSETRLEIYRVYIPSVCETSILSKNVILILLLV